mmetsp:Transcript_22858/g.41161  ORF Transcript_22858/g.41161 Transcript_22858/m.41161 type:complete len:268 (-) Transcript_22858:681-1484(-)
MCVNNFDDLPERFCWHHMHLIQKDQAPLDGPDLLHNLLTARGPVPAEAQHVECCHQHVSGHFFVLRREFRDSPSVDGGPHLELVDPLLHGDSIQTEYQRPPLDGRSGSDPDQRLPCPAGEHDDAAPGPAIAEHLCKSGLLVRPEVGGGLEVQIDCRVFFVIAEIIEHGQRELQFPAPALQVFTGFEVDTGLLVGVIGYQRKPENPLGGACVGAECSANDRGDGPIRLSPDGLSNHLVSVQSVDHLLILSLDVVDLVFQHKDRLAEVL